MIKTVTVTTEYGEVLAMNLSDPFSSGFNIMGIDGLGPVKGTINTTSTVHTDGGLYNSARLEQRNIVFHLGYIDDPSKQALSGNPDSYLSDIEGIRHKSYVLFPPKAKVSIVVETAHRKAVCYGYVESNEPDIFSQNVTATVSIICPDPYFYDYGKLDLTEVSFSSVISMFEFPFSNESLTDNKLVLGEASSSNIKSFRYEGDAVSGGEFVISFSTEVRSDIHIRNQTANTSLQIGWWYIENVLKIDSLGPGDLIIVTTGFGVKKAVLVHENKSYNIISAVTMDSKFPVIVPGVNTFDYGAYWGSGGMNMTMSFLTMYTGV